MSLPTVTDFLVIGTGIIGLSIARQLRNSYPDQSIVVIDKEAGHSMHASGRNSGVLHAGFYYTADSFKARFCRDGNRLMTAYCLENNLPINRCGKVVVARNEAELITLEELFRRGEKNGVELNHLDEKHLHEIEPAAKTCQRALYSPSTATVDPQAINQHLYTTLGRRGVNILFDTAYIKRYDGKIIETSRGRIEAGYVINAAGLYADRIARDFGFSENYTILPFKGLYLKASDSFRLKTNIYPVPDLDNPFLGVHFTVTVDGRTKIGPTAIPAFWREHYRGMKRFSAAEFLDIVSLETGLWMRNAFNFRRLAARELSKYYKPHLIRLAAELVREISPAQFTHWGRAGIRAQLLDTRTHTLEMDFRFEGDDASMHVLNAVSPAYTCSFPFAAYIVEQIEKRVGGAESANV